MIAPPACFGSNKCNCLAVIRTLSEGNGKGFGPPDCHISRVGSGLSFSLSLYLSRMGSTFCFLAWGSSAAIFMLAKRVPATASDF